MNIIEFISNNCTRTSSFIYKITLSLAAVPLLLGSSSIVLADEPGFVIEEVIVTARKREENLMDTPVSISAFTAEDIGNKQIERIHQIAESAPNVVFRTHSASSGNNNNAVVYIRGIGQDDFVPTVEPGVGIYLDDVYISQTTGAVIDILEIESIQVLRGPQGTLFGRNTIGGAVLINTKKPHEEFEGSVEFIGGSYDHLQGKAYFNVPISDNLFASATVMVRHKDGYVDFPLVSGDDGGGSDDTEAGRIALRWEPIDTLTIDLSADYTHTESDGRPNVLGSTIIEGPPPGPDSANYNVIVAPLAGMPPYTNAEYYVPRKAYTSFGTLNDRSDGEIWGVSLALDWDIGGLNFKSITNYRDVASHDRRDEDHSPIDIITDVADILDADQFTQEIQISGRGFYDRLKWLLGFYYFEEEALNANPVNFPFFGAVSGSHIDNYSLAVFSQATYDITDDLSLTFGLRYTKEEKDSIVDHSEIQYVTRFFAPGGLPFPAPPGTTFSGPFALFPPGVATLLAPAGVYEANEEQVDPYVSLSYRWNDDLLTYFSYSEGFKGGGFVQRVVPRATVTSFNPEFASVYEIGFKWDGLDNRLRLTGAGFFTDYTDLQITVNRGIAPSKENGGDAEIYGFELEATIVPAPSLQVTAGVGYLDAEYTKLDPQATIPITNLLPSIPEWQLNASAAYTVPLSGVLSGSLTARVDWSWTDGFFLEADNVDGHYQDSYHLLNAALAYTPDSEKWELVLQGRNITDKLHITAVNNDRLIQGYLDHTLAPPAEWNVKFKYYF